MLYPGGLCRVRITDCNVILFTGRFLSDDLFVTHKTLRARMKATLKKGGVIIQVKEKSLSKWLSIIQVKEKSLL